MQTFKFNNLTAEYDKGIYTLTADKGYALKNKRTGETAQTVKTKDYTEWDTIEGEAERPKKGKGKK
ncbi:MAG: hypothetical protein IJ588_01095 [Prevotella sp.]|nr:hypothetical protein [Prevotella sp.]